MGLTKMTPTNEQSLIIDAYKTGENLVIEAGAGTGKTATLKMLSNEFTPKKGLYLAFNKSIADEASSKFNRATACKTAHSLAFNVVGRQYKARLDAARVKMTDAAEFLGIKQDIKISENLSAISPVQLARIALQTVDYFCYSADMEINSYHVPRIQGLDDEPSHQVLCENVVPLAKLAWKDLVKTEGFLKYNHDYYLKLWQMSEPKLNYDYILLDEAQDTNKVLANIIYNQKNSQIILVGDRNQQLYQWRGALDIMSDFEGNRLYLSQSFRFGQIIADEANKWLKVLNADLRLTGCDVDSTIKTLINPDAILCRTNSKCISEVAEALQSGKKVALVGGGESIRKLAEASITLKAGAGTSHPELFAFENWDQVQSYSKTEEGADLKSFVDLVDKYGADGVIDIVDQLSLEKHADITVSTIHKSKGREWGSVKISDDFIEPKKSELNPNPKIEDCKAMLAYVGVTRAKYQLDCSNLDWVNKFI